MAFPRSKILHPVALLLRIALGGIFVYAAWSKLKDPWALFAMAINSYQVLPLWAVEWLARTLPWIELLIGALLIVGRTVRLSTAGQSLLLIVGRWMPLATAATSLLLLVFFTLIVRARLLGIEINCGCFGPGEAIS